MPNKQIKDVVYVKKWMRTRHAIMFRLSNKIVQVNFQDHTEIILSSESKVVTYVNKKGERLTYPLSTAMESSNMEMAKRLKYTKDILTHMLNANQPGSANQQKEGGRAATSTGGSSNRVAKEPAMNLGFGEKDAKAQTYNTQGFLSSKNE